MSVIAPDKLNTELVKLVQHGLMSHGYPLGAHGGADGIWGPATERAYHAWLGNNRQIFPADNVGALNRFYGVPDFENGRPPKQTYIAPPYPMRIAWGDEVRISRIRCHPLVADSLLAVLRDIALRYSPEEIKKHGLDQFGGTTNVRFMRGGTELSRHSWGIAIDLDPLRNGLSTPTEGAYIPNFCPDVADIFERHGWVSLGKRIGRDWMHFQATQ